MSKFESSIKRIPHSQQSVYNMLSDMGNVDKVKGKIPQDKVKELRFDNDSLAVNMPPVGELRLRIVEREEPKCVKFATEQSPIPFNLWIQILPLSDSECKMKLTVAAELNPLMRAMVSGPLQDGIEKIAEALAGINYADN